MTNINDECISFRLVLVHIMSNRQLGLGLKHLEDALVDVRDRQESEGRAEEVGGREDELRKRATDLWVPVPPVGRGKRKKLGSQRREKRKRRVGNVWHNIAPTAGTEHRSEEGDAQLAI